MTEELCFYAIMVSCNSTYLAIGVCMHVPGVSVITFAHNIFLIKVSSEELWTFVDILIK